MTLQETTKGPEKPTKQDTSKSLPKPIDPKEESKLRFDQKPPIDVDALGGPRNVISFLKATQTKIGTVALMEQIGRCADLKLFIQKNNSIGFFQGLQAYLG